MRSSDPRSHSCSKGKHRTSVVWIRRNRRMTVIKMARGQPHKGLARDIPLKSRRLLEVGNALTP